MQTTVILFAVLSGPEVSTMKRKQQQPQRFTFEELFQQHRKKTKRAVSPKTALFEGVDVIILRPGLSGDAQATALKNKVREGPASCVVAVCVVVSCCCCCWEHASHMLQLAYL